MRIEGATILITGGLSMIGSHAAEELLRAGASRIVLYDNQSFAQAGGTAEALQATGRVEILKGDVLDAAALSRACKGVDGVLALAGFMSGGIAKSPRLALDVNISGVLNVLEACREQGVKKLIFASSSAAYGYGKIAGAVTEAEPFHSAGVPAPPALYGASKVIGEQLCRLYRDQHGLDFIALRFSTVYGERQHYRSTNALYIIDAYDRVAEGKPPVLFGDGGETKDFVYVGDVARAIRLALASDVTGEAINISGGKPLTTRHLAETVIRVAGAELEPEVREPPKTGFRITVDKPFHYDNGKAKRLIGWEPEVSIEEGIRRLIAWRATAPRVAAEA